MFSTPLGNILIGCPPEVLKVIMSKHVPMPDSIVIPGTLHKFNSSLACLEFPFYHFLFIQQGVTRGRKFKILAKKTICQKIMEMLRVTLLGPNLEEVLQIESKLKLPQQLDKKKIKQVVAETQYLAPKNNKGRSYQLEEMVELIPLEIGDKKIVYDAYEDFPQVTIERKGEDEFLVKSKKELKTKLEITKPLDPVYEIKGKKISKSENKSKSIFSVRCLGASEGFDPTQPANGFLLHFNGKWILWDCPAFLHRHLDELDISFDDLDGIFISHVHEDHLDIMETIGKNKKIDIYTSPEIYHCMILKLMTILDCTYDEALTYYHFHPVYANKPFDLFDAEFEVFYSCHAIPALGLRLTVNKKNETSRLFLSGDTLSKRMLVQLKEMGVFSKDRLHEVENFLPENPCYNISFVDAGSGSIHGDPEDYLNNPCKIVYMHTGKKIANLPSQHVLLKAGQRFVIHK